MADRGTGVINPVVPNPSDVAFDYSFNWVPQQYGPAFVVSPVGVVGGPGAVYVDVAAGLDPAPPPTAPATTARVWTGTEWAALESVWDGNAWVPLAGSQVWTGTAWQPL